MNSKSEDLAFCIALNYNWNAIGSTSTWHCIVDLQGCSGSRAPPRQQMEKLPVDLRFCYTNSRVSKYEIYKSWIAEETRGKPGTYFQTFATHLIRLKLTPDFLFCYEYISYIMWTQIC